MYKGWFVCLGFYCFCYAQQQYSQHTSKNIKDDINKTTSSHATQKIKKTKIHKTNIKKKPDSVQEVIEDNDDNSVGKDDDNNSVWKENYDNSVGEDDDDNSVGEDDNNNSVGKENYNSPHAYKNQLRIYAPFCVFRKYIEINNSCSLSLNGIKGPFGLFFFDFLTEPGEEVFYKSLSCTLGFVTAWLLKRFYIIGFFSSWVFSHSLVYATDYTLSLGDFCILPCRKEYIFLKYRSLKILYKMDYHFDTMIHVRKTLQTWKKPTHNMKYNCIICLSDQENNDCYYHSAGSGEHTFCTNCLNRWRDTKASGNLLPCPLCNVAYSFADKPSILKFMSIEVCPEVFLEVSHKVIRSVDVMFRMLVFGVGIRLLIDTPLLNVEKDQQGDFSEYYVIHMVKFGGVEAGMALYNFCELLFFLHPQYFFAVKKKTDLQEYNLVFDIGVSIRFLV